MKLYRTVLRDQECLNFCFVASRTPWNCNRELHHAWSRCLGRVEKELSDLRVLHCSMCSRDCDEMGVASWRRLISSGSCWNSPNTVVSVLLSGRRPRVATYRTRLPEILHRQTPKRLPAGTGYTPPAYGQPMTVRPHNSGLLMTKLLWSSVLGLLTVVSVSNKRFRKLGTGPL